MSDAMSGEGGRTAVRGSELETAELDLRTERLAPLYDAAFRIFTWGFRIGAALLAVGVVVAHGRNPIEQML